RRKRVAQPPDDQSLAPPIHLGDEVDPALVVDFLIFAEVFPKKSARFARDGFGDLKLSLERGAAQRAPTLGGAAPVRRRLLSAGRRWSGGLLVTPSRGILGHDFRTVPRRSGRLALRRSLAVRGLALRRTRPHVRGPLSRVLKLVQASVDPALREQLGVRSL